MVRSFRSARRRSTRIFSLLKVPTSTFTLMNLLGRFWGHLLTVSRLVTVKLRRFVDSSSLQSIVMTNYNVSPLQRVSSALQTRRDQPGKFCTAATLVFSITAWLGTRSVRRMMMIRVAQIKKVIALMAYFLLSDH